jgi:hypothetical protein
VALTQLHPTRRDKMNAGDVFILHAGTHVWQWNGKASNAEEKRIGNQVARGFATKGNVKVLDQGVNDGESEAADFWTYLPGKIPTLLVFKKTLNIKDADNKDDSVKVFTPKLYEIQDYHRQIQTNIKSQNSEAQEKARRDTGRVCTRRATNKAYQANKTTQPTRLLLGYGV